MDYIFPFSTCEIPQEGIAQPFSFFINIISIFIVLYFLFQTEKTYNFLFILSLLIFEMTHTFSHYIHLPNFIQVNMIHLTSYVINALYLLILYTYTQKSPSIYFLLFLFSFLCFDIYAFTFLPFIYYFSSSIIIFLSILSYYYRYFSKEKKNYLITIFIFMMCVMILIYNENINCKWMLSMFPGFPFHAILEIFGTIGFYYVCNFFYKL